MASTTQSLPAPSGAFAALRRWLAPSLFDLVVLSVPIWFFGLSGDVASALVSDGDTGWHIRTGDHILSTGRFVYEDLFSLHQLGKPWFAWEWLTDVLYSSLHSALGLKGVVWLTIVLACLFFAITFRHMLWRGANLFVALPLALAGFGATTVHLLARPHIFTIVFVALAFWLIEADHRRPSWHLWLLAPLTALWANLHAGWLALVAILAITSAGTALEAWAGNGSWRQARRYALAAAACLASSILNPYGWHLHAHMAGFLSQGWAKELIGEYKSPSFRTENMLMVELVLLASLAACAWQLLRRRFTGPLLLLFWAHQSLQSTRHVPIFVALALPLLAEALGELWNYWTAGARRGSTPAILDAMARDAAPAASRSSLWLVLPFLILLPPWLSLAWPQDLSPSEFPVEMAARRGELLASRRLLTTDQWANYLIYHTYTPSSPFRQKTFLDGRSDFFGERIARDYCLLMNADAKTPALLRQYRLDAVLVTPNSPLAALLRLMPGWRAADEDKKSVLFLSSEFLSNEIPKPAPGGSR